MADFDWPSKRMVDLELLVDLCGNIDSWLRADVNNVAVIHCTVSVCVCVCVCVCAHASVHACVLLHSSAATSNITFYPSNFQLAV